MTHFVRNPEYTLYMHVNADNDNLFHQYEEAVQRHNNNVFHNPNVDSGFDLYVPEEIEMQVHKVNKVNFQVKCEMVKETNPSAFYMYPRSSISKSHFRLANNVGIIDSGYRGELIGMFDVIYSQEPVKCESNFRLLQICTPTLEPFKVVLVNDDSALSNTQRGEGGFGSTGGVAAI